jgi:hypothetical protein
MRVAAVINIPAVSRDGERMCFTPVPNVVVTSHYNAIRVSNRPRGEKKVDGIAASQPAAEAKRCLQRREMGLQLLQRLAIVFRQFSVHGMDGSGAHVKFFGVVDSTERQEAFGKRDLCVGISRARVLII